MKRFLLPVAFCLSLLGAYAQEVKLPAPDKASGVSLMEALSKRASAREFSTQPLSQQEMANLLWSAVGKNREDGKLTAPTAMNKQEVRLFVFAEKGVEEYMPQSHTLRPCVEGDHRDLVAGRQDFAKAAPVSLVLVADREKFGRDDAAAVAMTSVDVGIVCQNINLYCAAAGLVTVPRATMDGVAIQKLLGLNEKQVPVINNPVGYPNP